MYSAHARKVAQALLDDGRSLSQVSRETGIHRSTIRSWQSAAPWPGECPRCDEVLLPCAPYATLLGFYLGDGCLGRAARFYSVRISCDARLPGIALAVSGAMQAVRVEGRVFHVRAPGVVVVQGNWRPWPCLFHSDGSRTRNWAMRVVAGERRRYDYPRWEFANRSADIIGLCCWALGLAGVEHRHRTAERIAVSRREAVARPDAMVGPKE